MLLSDEEIDAVWPAPPGTNSMLAYARAIEAKVLEKMKQQEPVAEVKENPYCPEGHSDELTEYLPVGTKLYAAPLQQDVNQQLIAKAKAVVERWDTPLWKDVPATSGYINELRAAISAAEVKQ